MFNMLQIVILTIKNIRDTAIQKKRSDNDFYVIIKKSALFRKNLIAFTRSLPRGMQERHVRKKRLFLFSD